jgi:predicted RNase H-like HicB family nuclease
MNMTQSSSREDVVSKMTMIYWKGEKFWLGKLKEHPEIMTQGRTLKELEANLRDAYRMMSLEDVPQQHREKAIAI